jgi:hypothetical protein
MDELLKQFREMAIAAHCLHSGEKVGRTQTQFDDLQECYYTFCKERYRMYAEVAGRETVTI